jgi:hypothetical protein
VICPERGPGILEVKTADWLVRKQWGDEPPMHYLVQSQAYQGLDGVAWGDVLVLVGGNKLERFCYDFRPKIYAEIERGSKPSGRASRPTIRRRRLHPRPRHDHRADREGSDETTIDLTGPTTSRTKPRRRSCSRASSDEARSGRTPAKAELLDKLGAARRRAAQFHRPRHHRCRHSGAHRQAGRDHQGPQGPTAASL